MISEFPLFLYTTLAGLAAGGYLARAISPLPTERERPWAFSLVCLVLLAVSGVALLLHLGHPERVLGAFANPGAGITLEGVTTVLFGIAVFVDFVLACAKKESPRWLVVVASVLGVVMTLAMGFAYAEFIGTPAWAGAATVPFFVVGDLAMGAAFYLLFKKAALGEKGFSGYEIAVLVISVLCLVWMGAQFVGAGESVAPFIVGAVLVAIAVVLNVMGSKNGKASYAYGVFVLAVVGVAIARYAFYTGCII